MNLSTLPKEPAIGDDTMIEWPTDTTKKAFDDINTALLPLGWRYVTAYPYYGLLYRYTAGADL